MFPKGNKLWRLRKTFKHSEETKKKLSQRWQENYEERVRKAGFQRGHKINLGKHWKMSEEGRKRLSEVRKGKHYSPSTEFKKGMKLPKSIIEKMKSRIPWNKGKILPIEHRRKISLAKRGKHYPKVGLAMKLQWQNPEYREKTIRAQLKGLFKRPTSLENKFIELCNEANLPYKYVGDGSFIIGFKNPDFINTNGKKICVEVANKVQVHHPNGWAEKRIEHFKKYGWECLIFWEDDFKDKNKIIKELMSV